jgi:hypothetical protein
LDEADRLIEMGLPLSFEISKRYARILSKGTLVGNHAQGVGGIPAKSGFAVDPTVDATGSGSKCVGGITVPL